LALGYCPIPYKCTANILGLFSTKIHVAEVSHFALSLTSYGFEKHPNDMRASYWAWNKEMCGKS
jgi:hypothetical protein